MLETRCGYGREVVLSEESVPVVLQSRVGGVVALVLAKRPFVHNGGVTGTVF